MPLFCLVLFLQLSTLIPFIHHPEPQLQESRTFHEFSFKPIKSLESDSIYQPGIIRAVDEFYYVLDYSPYSRVLKLNKITGEIITVYGKQWGRGPGDTENLTDFAVSKNGNVWAADPSNARLTIFNQDGDPKTIILHKDLPYKLSGDLYVNYVALSNLGSTKTFLIDEDENILWESDELTENPLIWNNIVSGFLLLLDNHEVIKIGNYAGYIIRYNEKGSAVYNRRTIAHKHDPIGDPVRGADELIYNVDRRKMDHAVANGYIFDDKLVLFVQHMGDDRFQSLDVYDLIEGTYLYSYRLPESFRDLDITQEGRIVGIKPEGKILVWETPGF